MRNGFSKSGVPPNSVLFGGTVPPNSVLSGGTVPPNSFPQMEIIKKTKDKIFFLRTRLYCVNEKPAQVS